MRSGLNTPPAPPRDIAGTISAIQQQTRQAAERLNHSQAGVDASVEEIAELHPAMEQLRAGAAKPARPSSNCKAAWLSRPAPLADWPAGRWVAQTAEAFVHARAAITADSPLGFGGSG